MKSPSAYNGIVVVDKPAGMTSHDVVDVIRRLFRTKRVGHTGTLDPDATGVLVLCVGTATRLAEYLSAHRKHYVAEVVLGVETDTQDASGTVLAERDASPVSEADLQGLLNRFRGKIQQVPPMVSARHHEGKRLYELAREGVTVERAAREVQIDALEMTAFTPGEHPVAVLEITCSTGTYIRTLAADLGAAAGVGGMMRSLRRTWVGTDRQSALTLDQAHTLEDLRARADAGTLDKVVRPLSDALRSWMQVRLDAEELRRLRQGQAVPLVSAGSMVGDRTWEAEAGLIAALDEAGEVCVVARLVFDQLQPVKVLT